MGAYAAPPSMVGGDGADDDSVAFSIVVDSPTWQGWQAVETSGGHGVGPAGDAEILAAQLRLSRREGLYLEASSITLLAAERLRRRRIAADATVVLLGTSSGLKDVGATAAGLTPVPVIEPSLGTLAPAWSVGCEGVPDRRGHPPGTRPRWVRRERARQGPPGRHARARVVGGL